jgi:hypothetical protein
MTLFTLVLIVDRRMFVLLSVLECDVEPGQKLLRLLRRIARLIQYGWAE